MVITMVIIHFLQNRIRIKCGQLFGNAQLIYIHLADLRAERSLLQNFIANNNNN